MKSQRSEVRKRPMEEGRPLRLDDGRKKDRGQRSEVGNRKELEVGSQKSEIRGRSPVKFAALLPGENFTG